MVDDRMPARTDHTGRVFVDPDVAVVRPGRRVRGYLRYAASVGCVLGPFAFLFIFQDTIAASHIDVMSIPDTAALGKNCVVAGQQLPNDLSALRLHASDVSGRYSFAISSAAMRIVSTIAAVFAFFVIFQRTRFVVGCVTTAASLVFGLLFASIGASMGRNRQGTLVTLVNPIIDVAQKAELTHSDVKYYVARTVALNAWFGEAAAVLLLCGMAIVAITACDAELEPVDLRQRLFDLRWSIALAAIIAVMTVVITSALVDWQLTFLCEPYRDKLKSVGAALANAWGVGSSGFLLAAFLPAYFSWSRDVARWAAITKPDGTASDRHSLIVTEYLDFAPSKSGITLFTIATPALSGPFFEVVKDLLGKIG
jgi:hypothetical protein